MGYISMALSVMTGTLSIMFAMVSGIGIADDDPNTTGINFCILVSVILALNAAHLARNCNDK